MNALTVIKPYKWEGMWVFDDPQVDLVREPFVSGADQIIDALVANIPDAEDGFRLIFSPTPFPGYQLEVEWRRPEMGGNWYFAPAYNLEGWLCPALFKYFDAAPPRLYAKAEARSAG